MSIGGPHEVLPPHEVARDARRAASARLTPSRVATPAGVTAGRGRPCARLLDRPLPNGTRTLDQETCEKLFRCDAHVRGAAEATPPRRLGEDADRHTAATLARAMEANSTLFDQERERLDRWADDMVAGAEKALADTKAQLRQLNRQARLATTTEEQHGLQLKIRDLEREQRRQRQRIFDIEDEIRERRDELIDQLEQRMKQRTNEEELFTIRWRVV